MKRAGPASGTYVNRRSPPGSSCTRGAGMTSAGVVGSIEPGSISPAGGPPGTTCDTRDAQAAKVGGSAAASELAALDVDALGRRRQRGVELHQVHAVHQPRHGRRRLPARVGVGEGAGRGVGRCAERHLERGPRARDLAVERLGEVRHARLQRGAHPVALGLADVAEPAVLQRAEHGEKDQEGDRRGERPGHSAGHHVHSTRRRPGRPPSLHFLQNDCRGLTTSTPPLRHTHPRPNINGGNHDAMVLGGTECRDDDGGGRRRADLRATRTPLIS